MTSSIEKRSFIAEEQYTPARTQVHCIHLYLLPPHSQFDVYKLTVYLCLVGVTQKKELPKED